MLMTACTNVVDESELSTGGTRSYSGTAPVMEAYISSAEGTASLTVDARYLYKGSGIRVNGFVYSMSDSVPAMRKTACFTKLVTAKSDTISYKFTLVAKKTIYVRAWSISEDKDTVYSNVVTYLAVPRIPSIETEYVFNRTRIAAIVCGRFLSHGDGITSFGCCISRNPLPTLNDQFIAAADTATDASWHGYFGAFFDHLTPNTLYHVRAYCIASGDTIYGNDRIFRTSTGGHFTWSWNNRDAAEAAGAADRITQAMDSATYNYNNYSNLTKHMYINYNPGTPTADCTIGGWMNVGAGETYQWVGTMQHEMAHALGVGTACNWGSFGNPWDKMDAEMTMRIMVGGMNSNIGHDGMHFWPCGINYRSEVFGEIVLKANCMILNAMRLDGLAWY